MLKLDDMSGSLYIMLVRVTKYPGSLAIAMLL